jgi:hypothetical protein
VQTYSKTFGDQHLLLSKPLAGICWFLAAILLWLFLSSCFDSVVVFKYATVREPEDLKTATVRITEVRSRTPNFKVQLDDGEAVWLSFPDLLGGDPKGGLKMPQITDYARQQLTGCTATAKIRSVLSSFGRVNQVWDLDCPQAHIHYGPEVAASQINQHPKFDLVSNLLTATLLLFGAYLGGVVAHTLGKKQ